MILSPKLPETQYSDINSNNMLALVLTPRQLACQVAGSVKCDFGFTMAGATRLIARASSTALDSGVRFPSKFSVAADAFTLGQVLNFGSLALIFDCYGELHPLHGVAPVGNEPLAMPPPPELLGADLEVLAH
jgi:hypothetical protein